MRTTHLGSTTNRGASLLACFTALKNTQREGIYEYLNRQQAERHPCTEEFNPNSAGASPWPNSLSSPNNVFYNSGITISSGAYSPKDSLFGFRHQHSARPRCRPRTPSARTGHKIRAQKLFFRIWFEGGERRLGPPSQTQRAGRGHTFPRPTSPRT